MKIAVVSNCQGDSLASCLREMNSSLDIEFIISTDIENGRRNLSEVAGYCDYMFSQPYFKDRINTAGIRNVEYFPSIVFPAYQPDMSYLRGVRKGGNLETIESEMVVYHSAIMVFGYVNGIPAKDIGEWFNAHTYSRLGYFDAWDRSREDLVAEGLAAGMPLGAAIGRWARGGNFMFSMNHPKIRVMSDIAAELMQRTGLSSTCTNAADFLDDPLRKMSIWPVYPEIAQRYGLDGHMTFRRSETNEALSLSDFIERSYETYSHFERGSLELISYPLADMAERISLPPSFAASQPGAKRNPYSDARPVQFWKNSVAGVAPGDLDPVVDPQLMISLEDKIATAGSCFAQHIARTLSQSGFNYYVPESAPENWTESEAKESNYGTYSARYGNIYTVRQLLQLIERVEGRVVPVHDVWERKDGRIVDPFRPQIEPEGFVDEASMRAARDVHFQAVREMLREMDVFVFTLGLTEGWRSKFDGSVYPLAPGVAGGAPDMDIYEFHNFSVGEVCEDLDKVIDLLGRINPDCRIVLTVSPVPLVATYEPRHALVATTYSKAVLRAAAEHAARTWEHVEYFPSYEIITGSYNRGAYYEDDLREVKPEGVTHVMGVFMRHYTQTTSRTNAEGQGDGDRSHARMKIQKDRRKMFKVVCDEEAILNF